MTANRNLRMWAVFVAWTSVILATPAGAQSPAALRPLSDKHPARARLIANVDVAPREEPFWVGAYFEMLPDWHIYWTFPGNTGQPTKVQFAVDERQGMVAEPQFPAPAVFDSDDLETLSYGYDGAVLVPAEAVVFDPEKQAVTIAAEMSWLACKHLCVKGKTRSGLTLPLGERKDSKWADLFAATMAAVPESAEPEQAWLESLVYANGRFELQLMVDGLGEVEHFVPRWLVGGSCKVVATDSARDDRGRTLVKLSLTGESCLPKAGAVVVARGPDGESRPYQIEAYGPPETSAPPAVANPGAAAPTAGSEEPVAALAGASGGQSLWLLLLFAIAGGLLLNVMPCVIPVVVPKLLGVVRTAEKGEDPAAKRRLLLKSGIAYFAGVEATMVALGVTVVVLKLFGHEVGWGFQFQNPWFLAFMISLLVVLGLGMLQVFSLKSSHHQEQMSWLAKLFYKSPVLGSFFTGLLVTFLGTPCTAPLLGPALGYAFTASNVEIVLFLLAVGGGLALPFLLLGLWTGWTRLLPRKVSERYDRAMRALAFLLFATAVWLLSVMADGYSSAATMNMVWFLAGLTFATWLYGQLTKAGDSLSRRFGILAPLLVVVGLFGSWVLEFPGPEEAKAASLQTDIIPWQAFSDAHLAEVRAGGNTVFVDFTADWCMNCKANEKLVIETQATKAVFDRLRVVPLKADHTRFNPEIHAWLKRYNRAGVPMYLVFPPCAGDKDAVLLPEILSSNLLHTALADAGASRSSCN